MAVFRKKHFLESFSSLTKSDVEDGSIAGVISPYSVNNKQAVGLALANATDQRQELSDSIFRLYKKLEYGIRIDSSKYMEDFSRFSTLLYQSLSINNVLSGDSILLEKLADIITYAYVKKNGGKFRIFSDFSTAKSVVSIIFNVAKRLGLTFLSSEVEDTLQKVILSVIYKEDKKSDKPKPKPENPTKKLN